MDLKERISACRGLDGQGIAAALADESQDALTREIVELFGERTSVSRLPALPYSVRQTMYGDEDVSEWVLRFTEEGYSISEANGDASDAHIRWEHWEDAVRLVVGDVTPLSLLYGRRVVAEGVAEGPGEPPWFRAVGFSGSELDQQNRLLSDLVEARAAGKAAVAAFVAEHGIERITAARAHVMGSALVDAGGGPELQGSFMRMIVPADAPVIANVTFAPTTARPTLEMLGPEGDDHDMAGGVTLRYSGPDAMVAVASGELMFDQLLVKGMVQIEADPPRLEAFAIAATKFAELYGGR